MADKYKKTKKSVLKIKLTDIDKPYRDLRQTS